MPVPSRDGTNRTLINEYRAYTDATSDLRNWSSALTDAQGNIGWAALIRTQGLSFTRAAAWSDYLRKQKINILRVVDAPGLAQFAADITNQPALDLIAEHVIFMAALDSCTDWLVTNLPVGVSYVNSVDADGKVNYIFSTPAQAAPFADLMDALNATIDPQRLV